MKRRWERLSLPTQIAILLVSTILVLQTTAIFIDMYVHRTEQVVEARDGAANMFREAMPMLLRTPPENRPDVARSLATPIRVVLIEPQSGVRTDAGDVLLPERSAAISGFLRAQGVQVGAFEVAERRVMIPARPPGLEGQRPGLIDAVGERPPAILGLMDDGRLPRWVSLSGSMSDHTGHGLVEATAYVLALRLEDQTDWINLYSLVPQAPLLEPAILKAGQAAILVVVIGGIALFLLDRLMRPLRHLTVGAHRLGRGEKIEPIAIEGSVDLRETIDAFNQMSERVTQASDYQIGLLRSLGHDLKGPLAAMSLLLHKVAPDETRQQIETRLDGALAIVSAIMRFTRATMRDGEIVALDLPSLLEALVEEQADMGHTVAADLQPGVTIRARYNAMERVFRNLIENGVKYGGSVRVTLHESGGLAEIHVDDNGPGIPEEKLETVFRPFERLAQDASGSGLGLSIVKSIVVDHGGVVGLQNRPQGGLRVVVTIPIA